MGSKNKRPRRGLKSMIVDPFKQIKFGLYVMGVSLAFLAIFGFLFVNAFTDQYQHVMGIFNVVDPNLKWELVTNDVFKTNAMIVAGFFVFYIATMFTLVFHLTQRYYGPLVSIQRFVGQITDGQYDKRCKIREKDELQDLVRMLNKMADQIEARHGSDNQDSKDQKAS